MNYENENETIYHVTLIIMFIAVIINNITKLKINKSNIYLTPIAIIIGYIIGDLFSGIYHYFMDTYDTYLLKTYHTHFRIHHDNPLSMENYTLISTATEILPLGIVLSILSSYLLAKYPLLLLTSIITNIIMCSAQIVHRFAHRRTHEFDEKGKKKYYIPEFIKFLQDKHIILNNKEHRKHHLTEVMNYCISNSNSSFILDKIIDILNLPISTYKNSNNIHKYQKTSEKYDIIQKYLN